MTKDGSGDRGDSRIVDPDTLSARFPTQRHEGRFWESLGRAVGTFGFLEEVLGKAIFTLSATKPYDPAEIDAAYEKWVCRLERALTDPLSNLIEDYERRYGSIQRPPPKISTIWLASFGKRRGYATYCAMDHGRRRTRKAHRFRCLWTESGTSSMLRSTVHLRISFSCMLPSSPVP